MHATTLHGTRYAFSDLKSLMAKASPLRSGDCLAGVAAENATERVAAQMALADLPVGTFLQEAVVPYENDDVTRLIIDRHDASALAPLVHLTVGGLRDWLLSDSATTSQLAAVAPGLTPEMVAAVSKICRNQDLIAISAKCRIVTSFRNTIGLSGRLSSRLQPNHPNLPLAPQEPFALGFQRYPLQNLYPSDSYYSAQLHALCQLTSRLGQKNELTPRINPTNTNIPPREFGCQ